MRVVLIKPSKYLRNGAVERFERGFMPNATLTHIAALTPSEIDGEPVTVHLIDEYVETGLDYLDHLAPSRGERTLVGVVGTQSHQFHRALDLAALAHERGTESIVIGGPHTMTCDTSSLHGHGVSFASAEAERVWPTILADALRGVRADLYGGPERWAQTLPDVVIDPPPKHILERYWSPMLGLYPMRGCPFSCRFCSVIQIAGQAPRSVTVASTLESLRRARAGGVETVMFVSDNLNKYPQVRSLLQAMIDSPTGLGFFCQCDTQIARDPELIEMLARAGCKEMFVGIEAFDRETLRSAGKSHNRPETYTTIVEHCRANGILAHFSSIIGFPGQGESDIESHIEQLISIAPDLASFYILTPIPGTEQYDEFLAKGLIEEGNMDRFDGTCPTWRHDRLSADRLEYWLYECYRRFYGHAMRTRRDMSERLFNAVSFSRWCANRNIHPMSGGMNPVAIDCAEDYRSMRNRVFGIPGNVSLPASLRQALTAGVSAHSWTPTPTPPADPSRSGQTFAG